MDQLPTTDTRALSAEKPPSGFWNDIADSFMGRFAPTFGGQSEAVSNGESMRLGHYIGSTAGIGAEFLASAAVLKAGPLLAIAKLTHGNPAQIERLLKHADLKKSGASVGMIRDWRQCNYLSWLNETRLPPADAPVYKQVVGKVGHYLADKGLDKAADKAVVKELGLLAVEERAQALDESAQFAAHARAKTASDPRAATEVQLSWLEPASGIRVWAKPDVVSYRGAPPNETMIIRDNKSRDYLRPSDREQLDLFATVAVKQLGWTGKVEIVSELPLTKSYMASPFDLSAVDQRVSALSADLLAMDKAWSSADRANFPAKLQDFCRRCPRRSDCEAFMSLPARIRAGNEPMQRALKRLDQFKK